MAIKNKLLRSILYISLALLISNPALSQSILKRKNIDKLSPTELKAYEHAIQILHDRSMADVYDPEGYAWQAWVHNTTFISIPDKDHYPRRISPGESYSDYYNYIAGLRFDNGKRVHPGMCEHGKDLFFFWHRAEFYYFEKVLQNADPKGTLPDSKSNGKKGPSTALVTIPYWDFTKAPSGIRFPKAFENTASVLYRNNRGTDVPKFDYSKKFIQSIMDEPWLVFGGFPNSTGGIRGGFGRFEAQVHNPMHAVYCDGDMRDQTMAAYDPVFYSFHAYLDFVLDEWIRLNGMEATGKNANDSITSLYYDLRGQVPAKYDLKKIDRKVINGMGLGSFYLDHKELGYEYDVTPGERYQPRKTEKVPVFGKDPISPVASLTLKTIFAANGRGGILETAPLAGNTHIADGYYNVESNITSSYKVDVYFHPKSVKAVIADPAFRNKFLASSATYWKLGDESMRGGKTRLNIFIDPALKDVVKNFKKDDWVVTTNTTKL
jgi:tyrosinase